MTNEKISVALDRLMKDSYMWSQSAEKLSALASLAARLPIGPAQFSYLAAEAGAVDAYQRMQLEMARLLGEGAKAQQDMAERLYMVARAYEGDADDARDRLRRIAQHPEEVK